MKSDTKCWGGGGGGGGGSGGRSTKRPREDDGGGAASSKDSSQRKEVQVLYTASSGAEYEDSELESRGRTSKWKLVQGLSSSSELTPGALQKIPDSEPSWPIQKSL